MCTKLTEMSKQLLQRVLMRTGASDEASCPKRRIVSSMYNTSRYTYDIIDQFGNPVTAEVPVVDTKEIYLDVKLTVKAPLCDAQQFAQSKLYWQLHFAELENGRRLIR